jgi:hypothetical protein
VEMVLNVCGGGSWSGALQLAVVGASSMTTAGCLEGARAHPMGRGSVGNGSVPASRAGSPCSVDPDDAIHDQARRLVVMRPLPVPAPTMSTSSRLHFYLLVSGLQRSLLLLVASVKQTRFQRSATVVTFRVPHDHAATSSEG